MRRYIILSIYHSKDGFQSFDKQVKPPLPVFLISVSIHLEGVSHKYIQHPVYITKLIIFYPKSNRGEETRKLNFSNYRKWIERGNTHPNRSREFVLLHEERLEKREETMYYSLYRTSSIP